MGNIHGNCINVDILEGKGRRIGPSPRLIFSRRTTRGSCGGAEDRSDGCLYILDWYDRYHCYQDANRDPAGIDRSRAALPRAIQDTPPGLV